MKVQDLKDLGKWCGSLYRMADGSFALKITGRGAVWLTHEEIERFYIKETVVEKRLMESGR